MEVEPNSVIKDWVANGGAESWKHKERAKTLYEVSDALRFYFFSPQDESQPTLPQLLLSIEPMRRDILGAFRLTPNGNGLPFEVIINEVWADRPLYELSETILHEQLHMYRVEVSKEDPRGNYHSKGFVAEAEQMGLHPKLNEGYHLKPADGQFEQLMVHRLGIEKPSYVKDLPTNEFGVVLPPGVKNWFDIDRGRKTGGRIKGESNLKKWSCECSPPQSVRVGKSRLAAICLDCREPFTLQSY